MAGSGRQNADPILIAALLSGATIVDAAERAGVSEQTARRRLRNLEFRARLNAAGDDLVAAAARAIADANGEAVSALRDLLRDGPPAVRLGAARTILEFTPRFRAAHDHEERLALAERSLVELREQRGRGR
jgi:hypothetical protein